MKYQLYIGKNKFKKDEKHPDLKVALVTKNGDKLEFKEIGGLWKKNQGYMGWIDTEAVPYKKEAKQEAQESEIPF